MSSDLSRIQGVVFDLWNTLCWSDYRPSPMVLIAEALGIAASPGWKKKIERGMMTRPILGIREGLSAVESHLGSPIQDTSTRELLVRRWNEACAATKLYDDALPALRALRGRYRIGILSNTQSFDLDILRSSGLEPLVDAICLSCDFGRLKPDPLFFSEAAERLGLHGSRIVMVGDSVEDDVGGALRAGWAAIHLARVQGVPAVPGVATTVRSLNEIPALLPSTRGSG